MADEKVIFEVDISSLSKAVITAQADLDMYRVALEESTKATGKWSEETVAAKAALDAQNKTLKQTEGALLRVTQAEQALGGDLNKLVKTYDASNKSVDQNRKVLNALTAEYNKLTGQARANLVPTIKSISDELKKQEGQIGDTRRNVGNYFNEFAKGVPQLGAAVEGVKGLGIAFQSAGGGIKGFGAALATTGLPLLITGVNLLIDAFKTFTPLAEAVEDIMGGLSTVFTSSYNEGVKVVQLKRQLEENDRNQIVTNAVLKKSITELEAIAANKAAKDQDRIDALRGANKLREEQLQLQKEDAQGQLELINLQVESERKSAVLKAGLLTAIGFGTRAKVNSETLKQQQLANAKLIELDEETGKQIRENQNKIDQLNESIAEENKAKEEKQIADSKERIENSNREKDRLRKEELAQFKQTQEDLAELVGQSVADEKALYDSQIENIKLHNSAMAQLETNAQLQLELHRQTNLSYEQIDAEFAASNYKTFAEFYAAKKKLYEDDVRATKMAEDAKVQYQKASLQAAGGIANDIIGLVGQVAEAQGEGAEFAKALAFIQILTQQAIAIATAVAGGTQSGAATGPAAIGTIPAFISTLVGAVVAVIGGAIGLLSKPIPKAKFATGVIGLDGSGTETSDSIDAKLSKGESVVTAKATRRFHRELAYMEMAVGNKPNYQFGHGRFAGGFIPQLSSDGGFVSREAMKASDSALFIREAIRSGFASAPQQKLSIVEYEIKKANMDRSIKISEA